MKVLGGVLGREYCGVEGMRDIDGWTQRRLWL